MDGETNVPSNRESNLGCQVGFSPSANTVFSVLANEDRRAIIRYLLEKENRVQIDTLQRNVLEQLGRNVAADHQRQQIESQLTELYDENIIEYDRKLGQVIPQPIIYEYKPFLQWAKYLSSP